MFAQALHIVTRRLPAWTVDRIATRARRETLTRVGPPDRFIRGIPQVSERWLAEHRRTLGKEGHLP